jgi:hypothetical protein
MNDDPPLLDTLRRPALRPGLRVVRRDDRHLQIGLDPPLRLVVEDAPDIRRVLAELRTGQHPTPTTPGGHRLLTRLLAEGLLVDAADLGEAVGAAADRAGVTAAFAQFGADAPARLRDRAAARVAVEAPADLAHTAVRLLRSAGVGLTTREDEATALLVISAREIPRARLDPAVRAGLPHLLVTGSTVVTVGPFVVPGATACVRCVDAHLGEGDPRRAMVVDQCSQEPPTAGPEPRDAALLTMAVAWAVRDLVGFVDGDQPATWSTSVTLGPALALVPRRWTRHPHCGCSWGETLAAG